MIVSSYNSLICLKVESPGLLNRLDLSLKSLGTSAAHIFSAWSVGLTNIDGLIHLVNML